MHKLGVKELYELVSVLLSYLNFAANLRLFQLSDYLVESVKRDKYREPKDKTTHAELKEAAKMLQKYATPPATRSVYSKKGGFNHRTVVKEDKGLRPGKVERLTVLPPGPHSILTKDEVVEIAQPILTRRTHLEYDSFDQFCSDSTSIAFVEHIREANGNIRYECSCLVGSKGSKPCVHVLTLEIEDGSRPHPTALEDIMVAKTVKKAGRPKKTGKQKD